MMQVSTLPRTSLSNLRSSGPTTTCHLKLVFAPEAYIPPNARAETLGLDLDQLCSITALRARIGECTSAIHSLGTPAPSQTPYLSIDDLTDDDYP